MDSDEVEEGFLETFFLTADLLGEAASMRGVLTKRMKFILSRGFSSGSILLQYYDGEFHEIGELNTVVAITLGTLRKINHHETKISNNNQ